MSASDPVIKLWTNGIIPYQPFRAHPARDEIASAMLELERRTRIRFVPRTTEAAYVRFTDDEAAGNGSAGVGMPNEGDPLNVNLKGDAWWALHELCHVVGLIHEQCRSDSQSVITTNYRTSESKTLCGGSITIPANPAGSVNLENGDMAINCSSKNLTPFDAESVMQYATDMGRIPGTSSPSMTLKSNPGAGLGASNRRALSALDAAGIQALYQDVPSLAKGIAWNVWTVPSGFPPVSMIAFDAHNTMWGVRQSDGTAGYWDASLGKWVRLIDSAVTMIAFNGSDLWAIGKNHQGYRWTGGNAWIGPCNIGGYSPAMLAFGNGEAWAVDTAGGDALRWDRTLTPAWFGLYSPTGAQYSNLAWIAARDGAPGEVYFVNGDGSVGLYNLTTRVASPVEQNWKLQMMAFDRSGTPYCVSSTGAVGVGLFVEAASP